LLFAVLIKATIIPDVTSSPFKNTDYLLSSILQFTNSDGPRVFNQYTQINLWVLAFERIMAFYYLVIAILAFSSTNTQALDDIKEKIHFLVKRHYNHFARNSIKYIQHKGLTKLMPLEEFKKRNESLKNEIKD